MAVNASFTERLQESYKPLLVCVMLHFSCPFAPSDRGDGAQYITQYTVICLWLKFLLSFEAHTGVLCWSGLPRLVKIESLFISEGLRGQRNTK